MLVSEIKCFFNTAQFAAHGYIHIPLVFTAGEAAAAANVSAFATVAADAEVVTFGCCRCNCNDQRLTVN